MFLALFFCLWLFKTWNAFCFWSCVIFFFNSCNIFFLAEEISTTPEGEPQGSPQFATEETDSAPEEVKKDTGETPEGLAYLSDESDTKPSVSEDNTANEVVTQELFIK